MTFRIELLNFRSWCIVRSWYAFQKVTPATSRSAAIAQHRDVVATSGEAKWVNTSYSVTPSVSIDGAHVWNNGSLSQTCMYLCAEGSTYFRKRSLDVTNRMQFKGAGRCLISTMLIS